MKAIVCQAKWSAAEKRGLSFQQVVVGYADFGWKFAVPAGGDRRIFVTAEVEEDGTTVEYDKPEPKLAVVAFTCPSCGKPAADCLLLEGADGPSCSRCGFQADEYELR